MLYNDPNIFACLIKKESGFSSYNLSPVYMMNSQSHPILIELSEQLPETSTTYKYIHGPETFSQVATQAKEDFSFLSDLESGLGNESSARNHLMKSGYESWLKAIDEDNEGDADDERLRLIGFLKLIIELAEELVEE